MTGDKIDFAKLSRSEQNEIVKVIKTDFRAAKTLYKTCLFHTCHKIPEMRDPSK